MRFGLSSVDDQLDPVCWDVEESVDESLSATKLRNSSFVYTAAIGPAFLFACLIGGGGSSQAVRKS